jgi:hypothetical protein
VKTNIVLFWVLAVFFVAVGITYAVWSLLDPFHGTIEWVGTLALFLSAALFALVAFYLGKTYKAQGAELPEDRPESTVDDGDPEIGFFSPWSWWPLMLGTAAATVFLGIAVGTWIVLIGFALAIIAIVGWTFEYYRGYFGR